MDNIKSFLREKLQEPRNLAIAAGLTGLIIGLFFAYVIFPVQWTDASAENLRADLRIDYLRNAITTFTLTGDRSKALQAYTELGNKAEETLTELVTNPGFLNSEQIQRYTTAINTSVPSANSPATQITLNDGSQVTLNDSNSKEKPNSLLWLGLGLLAVLILGAGAVYWFYFREKGFSPNNYSFGTSGKNNTGYQPLAQAVRRQDTPPVVQRQVVQAAVPPKPAAQRTSIFANGTNNTNGNVNGNGEKPIAQFMSTYVFGDDRYDESFTFDAPNGAFLGECGISISDLIGVGEPKKISAFDIWLFDKNDIQTVTKVIMSKHAFNDPDIRSRLEIRGEPILAEQGKLFRLETATLRLEGRIVDVSYGDLPLPEDSYFQRNTVELAVYRK